ncbi:MAG: fasciclin domain-containing protein [Prevotella sp.]|nr:fasciclin domain-containing protein [Prevotella sp.]
MNCKQMKHGVLRPAFAIGLMLGSVALQSCSDDILTGQPSWLGNSIYEELQKDGNYTVTLKLIDDLGLHDQMSKTGSLTIFVADDATYDQWFKTNTWGARSYEALSTAQKKTLLNNSIVNNAYLIELLSNVSGDPPETGMAMRRTTASSVFDSVYVMKTADMNGTLPAWSWYKNNNKDIVLFKDGRIMSSGTTSNLSAPMIHFLPAFMQKAKFTDQDISVLTNGAATSVSDAYVSGQKVVERDITCKNGYIQKVDGVLDAAPNMAEILRQHPELSMWSHLIDRFSAPYYDYYKTLEYNRLYNQNVDSVFTLRYFADARTDGLTTQYYPVTAGNPVPGKVAATLAFDPGWNQYMYENTSGYDLHYDAGAMLVPTNAALEAWWNADGKVLQDKYKTWDNVPDLVLSKLLNVNMIGTFTDAIPSKFDNIINDSKVSMGVKLADVDSCFVGCNGVVYMTNRVFSPMAYSSVSFPALIHQDVMSVIYWAIDELEFTPYLNSMDSYYSLLLPTNTSMLTYVDPCTYGESQETMLEFYFDSQEKTVKARRYACDIDANGNITKGTKLQESVPTSFIKNRLKDLVNQLIIVGSVENGYSYYKSKNGTMVKVANAGQKNSMTVMGGWQLEHNTAANVDSIYDMSKTGNGKSYRMNEQMPLPSGKSVYQTLKGHDEYSEFLKLLSGSENLPSNDQLLVSSMNLSGNKYNCANSATNSNIRLFGSYNYTVYVPTNESIKQLISDGLLPTWDDYDEQFNISESSTATDAEKQAALQACEVIKNRIFDFVRYHMQDNSVAVDGAPEEGTDGSLLLKNNFESMMLNSETNRYYPLEVDVSNKDLTIKDLTGDTRHVVKTSGLYNNICREYWISGSSFSKLLYTSADAVVHLIDGALFYSSSQKTPWKQSISNAKRWRK